MGDDGLTPADRRLLWGLGAGLTAMGAGLFAVSCWFELAAGGRTPIRSAGVGTALLGLGFLAGAGIAAWRRRRGPTR